MKAMDTAPYRNDESVSRRLIAWVSSTFLFLLNAWICWQLWFAGFIDQMGSVDGSFIAVSRYVMSHWADLSWFPLWFCGMPFARVYQPGLHVSVAALATVFDLQPERAYHITTAFLYVLGPVTLAWLCYRLTLSQGFSLTTGLLYSLFSPSILLSTAIRNDLGGWTLARRFQALVHYGEGPHIAALTLIPLAVWALHEAIGRDRRRFLPLVAIFTGAVVATNWTGTAGLAMVLIAYFVSQTGNIPLNRALRGLGAILLGYLLICPWVPPSVVSSIPSNAVLSDQSQTVWSSVVCVVILMLLTAALHFAFDRFRTHRVVRFFVLYFLFSGFVVLAKSWGNTSMMPQPHRFHLEMEMALIPAVLAPIWLTWSRWHAAVRAAMLALLLLFCVLQVGNYKEYVRLQTLPLRIQGSIEYRMAKWFQQNAPNQRIFAPGSVSIWMNNFTDTPQMVGCCDQSVPSLEQRIAFYTIYTGSNAGTRDAEIARLWLKSYGASFIGVTGPRSKEVFRGFTNPREFEATLPVLWSDGEDDIIYQVPGRSSSLAHVILPKDEVVRAPVNGNDVGPLEPYVRAIDDATLPLADMRWVNPHRVRVETRLQPSQLVSIQISYAPGWHAFANRSPALVRPDALGLMIIEPQCVGECRIDLTYESGPEAGWTRVVQLVSVALTIGLLLKRKGDPRL